MMGHPKSACLACTAKMKATSVGDEARLNPLLAQEAGARRSMTRQGQLACELKMHKFVQL